MIHPETQTFMAWRMNATVRWEKLDHTPLITAPKSVVQTDRGGNGSRIMGG